MRSLTAGAVRDPPVQDKAPIPSSVPVRPTIKESETLEPQQLPKKISRGVSTDQKKVRGAESEIRPTQDSQANKENISRPCSRASKASTGTKTFTVDDDSSQKGDERVKMCKSRCSKRSKMKLVNRLCLFQGSGPLVPSL